MKACAAKIISAAIIAEVLVLLAFVAPEHMAEQASHDNCVTCQFIKNTPLLEPEAAPDIAPLFQEERLPFIFCCTDYSSRQPRNPLSRAPPLF